MLICAFHFSNAQTGPAAELAAKIADRMKDTLLLTTVQRDSVYQINLSLHEQKMAVRSQQSDSETMRQRFQEIENTRDGRYRTVLGEEKFLLYKQKKRNLISN